MQLFTFVSLHKKLSIYNIKNRSEKNSTSNPPIYYISNKHKKKGIPNGYPFFNQGIIIY